MRQVDHGLNGAAEEYAARFIQQQRQDDRAHLIGDDLGYGDDYGVAEDLAEFRQRKQKLEILPADPGRCRETARRAEILKGDDDAVHRIVAEQEYENQSPGTSMAYRGQLRLMYCLKFMRLSPTLNPSPARGEGLKAS